MYLARPSIRMMFWRDHFLVLYRPKGVVLRSVHTSTPDSIAYLPRECNAAFRKYPFNESGKHLPHNDPGGYEARRLANAMVAAGSRMLTWSRSPAAIAHRLAYCHDN
jgi:hypothetical protein